MKTLISVIEGIFDTDTDDASLKDIGYQTIIKMVGFESAIFKDIDYEVKGKTLTINKIPSGPSLSMYMAEEYWQFFDTLEISPAITGFRRANCIFWGGKNCPHTIRFIGDEKRFARLPSLSIQKASNLTIDTTDCKYTPTIEILDKHEFKNVTFKGNVVFQSKHPFEFKGIALEGTKYLTIHCSGASESDRKLWTNVSIEKFGDLPKSIKTFEINGYVNRKFVRRKGEWQELTWQSLTNKWV